MFVGVLFNIAQSLPSHTVFEMFQAIGNIFGKVLSFDICQCVQKLEEKLEDNEKVEVIENGWSQNGEVHEGKDKVDVNEKVGKTNSFICCCGARVPLQFFFQFFFCSLILTVLWVFCNCRSRNFVISSKLSKSHLKF